MRIILYIDIHLPFLSNRESHKYTDIHISVNKKIKHGITLSLKQIRDAHYLIIKGQQINFDMSTYLHVILHISFIFSF